MLKKNRLTLAVSAAIGLTTASVLPMMAQAQEEGLVLEEVVVTGSAIKRKDLDNALPVQVLGADQIARAGITNAGELINKIPSMQNFTTPGDTVGGDGGGIRTANLRAIGEQYTLSLLNGRRMAPADSGSTIDLSNIPMAAVERVEVLTDGASALYGADAIAGVVNFILKDSVEETTLNIRGEQPDEDGGEGWNFDIVTGFGDLASDGYSLVFTYSHEERDALAAADRDFAKTGLIEFGHNGQQLYFENTSSNTIPGNAWVYTEDFGELIKLFSPYRFANGNLCPKQTTPSDDNCRFDYTSTIEIIPETERDSIFLNGKVNFTENMTGFATVMYSEHEMLALIAPYPTGEVPLPLDSQLVKDEVYPWLTPEELAQVGEVAVSWRALPLGNRNYEWQNESTNVTFGIDGSAGEIDYNLAATYAETQITQDYPTGWLLTEEFVEIAGSGDVNLFAGQEEFTDEDKQTLAPAVYHGNWDEVDNTMTVIEGRSAMPVFDIGGGAVMAAAGFDWRTTNYERSLSDANAQGLLLFNDPDTAYELERDQWGIFTEWLFPILDNLEVTGSLRYDDVSATEDKLNGGDIDKGDSDTTYKISGLWTATDWLSLRGSFGTGFKPPSMREIGEPRSNFGVTSGTYACPFAASDPRTRWCKPGENQANVFREGSADLKFETSEQYSVGFVVTAWDSFEMVVDYWNIELEDVVDRVSEAEIFGDPVQYDHLFTFSTNSATGRDELAIVEAAQNFASKETSGIDWAFAQGFDLNWGHLDLGLRGTYMIESDRDGETSLGQHGSDNDVVFRNQANFNATLYHGNFTHTWFTSYRSGYRDQTQVVEILGTGAALGDGPTTEVRLDISSYTTSDYQLRWSLLDDSLALIGGVRNIFDKQPHLSLQTAGSGHQVGWDPRYTDAFGRTYYLQAQYSF